VASFARKGSLAAVELDEGRVLLPVGLEWLDGGEEALLSDPVPSSPELRGGMAWMAAPGMVSISTPRLLREVPVLELWTEDSSSSVRFSTMSVRLSLGCSSKMLASK
jgi:hypothetical protein